MGERRSWMGALERRYDERTGEEAEPDRAPVTIRIPGGLVTGMVVTALSLAIGAALLTYGVVERARHGVEANGTVVERWTGRGVSQGADVEFTTPEGQRFRASIGQDDWYGVPKVGAQVRVRYVPSDPAGTAVDAHQPRLLQLWFPALLWAGALVFGILAVVRLLKSRSAARR